MEQFLIRFFAISHLLHGKKKLNSIVRVPQEMKKNHVFAKNIQEKRAKLQSDQNYWR
jgi:hypothetical protein